MSDTKKIPNRKGEYLIDVTPDMNKDGVAFIYDITPFFDYFKGIPREQMVACVDHTVKGKKYTVHIIDRHKCLDKKSARRLAKEWYLGNTVVY